jgi:proteic killer suppression protein
MAMNSHRVLKNAPGRGPVSSQALKADTSARIIITENVNEILRARVVVDILFASKNLEHLCLDDVLARRALGNLCAQKLRARLDDLRAAVNLGYAPLLPGRFHPLQVNSQQYFALRLDAGRRLVIEPVCNPAPKLKDGSWNLSQVTTVRVMEVGST